MCARGTVELNEVVGCLVGDGDEVGKDEEVWRLIAAYLDYHLIIPSAFRLPSVLAVSILLVFVENILL